MARNQKLSYKMNMFHFLTKQSYSKYSQTLMSMSFSSSEASTMFRSSTSSSTSESVIFWEEAFIRRGRLFEGTFILKSEILGGGVHSRRGVYSRKYGKPLGKFQHDCNIRRLVWHLQISHKQSLSVLSTVFEHDKVISSTQKNVRARDEVLETFLECCKTVLSTLNHRLLRLDNSNKRHISFLCTRTDFEHV